jgi:hypothetical protein
MYTVLQSKILSSIAAIICVHFLCVHSPLHRQRFGLMFECLRVFGKMTLGLELKSMWVYLSTNYFVGRRENAGGGEGGSKQLDL